MKYYEIAYPSNDPVGYDIPVFEVLSEDQIVREYGDYSCLMYLTRIGYLPTRQEIIDNWCVVHWATELK